MAASRTPYYYLERLATVLIVDDDKGVRDVVAGLLAQAGIYSVLTASTAAEAEAILSLPQRVHCCIMDLGLADVGGDEFHILRTYGARTGFIVFTGRTSPSKGFEAARIGADAMMEKSAAFNMHEFLKTVDRVVFMNIINPFYKRGNESLNNATDTLFSRSPQFVGQWAQHLGLTDRALRFVWTRNLGANAKIILYIYKILSSAFGYYEKELSGAMTAPRDQLVASEPYVYLEEAFHMHRSSITDFIAYGNIAIH